MKLKLPQFKYNQRLRQAIAYFFLTQLQTFTVIAFIYKALLAITIDADKRRYPRKRVKFIPSRKATKKYLGETND